MQGAHKDCGFVVEIVVKGGERQGTTGTAGDGGDCGRPRGTARDSWGR